MQAWWPSWRPHASLTQGEAARQLELDLACIRSRIGPARGLSAHSCWFPPAACSLLPLTHPERLLNSLDRPDSRGARRVPPSHMSL